MIHLGAGLLVVPGGEPLGDKVDVVGGHGFGLLHAKMRPL